MKTIKNIPNGIKIILLINLIVFFVFMFLETCFNLNLTTYFSANITSSDYFNPVQIITFMFIHSNIDFLHITSNLLILLFFGISLEKIIGYKHAIILYLFSGLCSFLFFNIGKEMEKEIFEKNCVNNNINLNKLIQYKSGEYEFNEYFISLNNHQQSFLNKYGQVNGIFLGASGSVAGFIIIFVLTHFFNFKSFLNIFKVLVGCFFVAISILHMSRCSFETSGTAYGHLGGIVGGFIYFIIYKYMTHKKRY